jgi:hypothetical protein
MIDQAKLNALSLETLRELRERITDTIARKVAQDLRVGSIATFESKKFLRQVTIRIESIGPKNVIGTELDAQGKPLRPNGWQVGRLALTPVTARPSTGGAGSF